MQETTISINGLILFGTVFMLRKLLIFNFIPIQKNGSKRKATLQCVYKLVLLSFRPYAPALVWRNQERFISYIIMDFY